MKSISHPPQSVGFISEAIAFSGAELSSAASLLRTGSFRLEETSGSHLVPPPTQSQSSRGQMAQDLVQLSVKSLLRWKWHSFSGQTVLVLNCPHGENYLPNIGMNFPCCSLCPSPFIPPACTTQKSLSPVTKFWRAKTSPLGLLIMGLDKRSSECLSSNIICSCPLTILVILCLSCSSLSRNFLNWGTPKWTQYSSCGFTSVEQKRMTSPDLLAIALLIQPSTWLVFATVVYCSHMFSLGSTRTTRSLSEKLLSRQLTIPNCCPRLFHPTWRTWHLPLLIVMRLLSVHSSHCQGPSKEQPLPTAYQSHLCNVVSSTGSSC